MNRKSFWKGFAIGGIILIITLTFFYFKLFTLRDISLNEVEIVNLNGEKIELTEYIGKPLVINYWATWCAPCLKEFPYFEEVKKQYGDEVNFIMVSDEDIDKIKKFASKKDYTFKYLMSPKNLSSYNINTIQVTYFYNSKGNITTKHKGSLDEKTMKSLIEMSN
jgi:thiol-disulfide isomerase/thioredoxin